MAKHVFLNIFGIPVFYVPYYWYYFDNKDDKFYVVPGVRSKYGSYLLNGYRYHLNENNSGVLQIDYSRNKGFGYHWNHSYDSEKTQWLLLGYYVDEKKKGDRHRIKFVGHNKLMKNMDAFFEIYHNSDQDIVKDHMREEFEHNVHWDSYFYNQYRLIDGSLSCFFKKRVKYLDYNSRSIRLMKKYPLYWEMDAQYANTQKVLEDENNEVLKRHRLFLSNKLFYSGYGFGINCVPYVGLSQTFFDPYGFGEDDSFSRHIHYAGVSLKKHFYHRIDYKNKRWDISQIYVFLEPTVSYSYQKKPNGIFEKSRRIDDLDHLEYKNCFDFSFETRLHTKKLQKQRMGRYDVVRHKVGVLYYPEPEKMESQGDHHFSDIYESLRIRPTDYLYFDLASEFDFYKKKYKKLSFESAIFSKDKTRRVYLRNSYLTDPNDPKNEMTLKLFWDTQKKWIFFTQWSYNLEHNFVGNQKYMVWRNFHCLNLSFNYSKRKDLSDSVSEFWITFKLNDFVKRKDPSRWDEQFDHF